MKSFIISSGDINTSTKHLKDKTIRTPEKTPPYFIKHAIPSLVFPLLLIFNCSLALSEIPKQWKTSYVIPVYKKGIKHDPLNYRPISLTSTFSQIFEHIISQKIFNHIFDFNLLTPKQFGFVPYRSSGIQLLTYSYTWLTTYLNNESVTVVYTDIKKAFDSVSHIRLLKIMTQYGFDDNLVNWLSEFLNNRTQSVLINNTLSDPLKIHSGVSLGGVIGPLLFLIYINDITFNTQIQSEISLFADDAKVFSKSETSLQITLDNIHEWLKTRKLDLNPKKC